MAKGKLAEMFPSSEGEYTDLSVQRSGAGYYIGTMFKYGSQSSMPGAVEPGSRESEEYYATEVEAEEAFKSGSWTQRKHP